MLNKIKRLDFLLTTPLESVTDDPKARHYLAKLDKTNLNPYEFGYLYATKLLINGEIRSILQDLTVHFSQE